MHAVQGDGVERWSLVVWYVGQWPRHYWPAAGLAYGDMLAERPDVCQVHEFQAEVLAVCRYLRACARAT